MHISFHIPVYCVSFNQGDQGEIGEEGDEGKVGKNGPAGLPGRLSRAFIHVLYTVYDGEKRLPDYLVLTCKVEMRKWQMHTSRQDKSGIRHKKSITD